MLNIVLAFLRLLIPISRKSKVILVEQIGLLMQKQYSELVKDKVRIGFLQRNE